MTESDTLGTLVDRLWSGTFQMGLLVTSGILNAGLSFVLGFSGLGGGGELPTAVDL